jgi:hypothetical protein
VQEPASCAACGGGTVERAHAPRTLLFRPNVTKLEPNTWLSGWRVLGALLMGLFCMVLAVSSLRLLPPRLVEDAFWLPFVAAVAGMLLFGLFRRPAAKLRVRAQVRSEREDVSFFGRVRGDVRAEVMSEIVVGDDRELFLRTARRSVVQIDAEDGRELYVEGVVFLTGAGVPASADVFGPWAEYLPNVPCVRRVVHGGERILVAGPSPSEEQRTDGYRDRPVLVVRGSADQPVLVRRAPLR